MSGSDWNYDSQDEPAGGPPAQPPGQYPPPSGQYPPPGYPPAGQYPPPSGQYPPPGQNPPPPGQYPPGPAGPGGPWSGSSPSDTVEFSRGGHGAPAPGRKRMLFGGIAAAVVVVVVAVVAIAVAGHNSPSQASPAQVLAAAAHKAASVNTLSATYSERISGLAGGTISGSVQEVRKPLRMSMTMTESMGGQTIPLSAVLTGQAMYMKFGSVSGLPPSIVGKWIEFPLTRIGGGFSSLLQSVQNENPTSQAQLLLASKHLRADGKQVIDGVETTKYVGSFTPAAALKMLPAGERAALGPAIKRVTGNIDFSVWIDGNNQIRQFVDVETVASETVTATFNFQSFNQPLTITTPPANKVVHIPSSAFGG